MKTSLVHITSYHGKVICGYLENSFFADRRYFANFTQFFLVVEDLLNQMNFPQRDTELRRFPDTEPPVSELRFPVPDAAAEPIATFSLTILFRQNASWQGNLLWRECAKEGKFRSALELVFLLDSALSQFDSK